MQKRVDSSTTARRRTAVDSPAKITTRDGNNHKMTSPTRNDNGSSVEKVEMEPLMIEQAQVNSGRAVPLGSPPRESNSIGDDFAKQAVKFFCCFAGLQASYLTWGYMQELIMTTKFEPTPNVPSGMFPSAAFCVFSNRFLAVIVALISVRLRHGSFFANNKAPLLAFTPCAISNTMSSWSQYKALLYVSFPVQTVFKSSKGMFTLSVMFLNVMQPACMLLEYM